MLVLLFEVAESRYALETSLVVEVVPFVELKKIPKARDFVAGLVNYRGRPLPVVDLGILLDGRPSESLVSTRIIIIQDPFQPKANRRYLGLIAPQVTETFNSRSSKQSGGVLMDDELYNGVIASEAKGMVQLIELKKILPEVELAPFLDSSE